MTQVSERRDPGARRVSVSTLVEVVGNVPGIPVFEAEAVDVSARGMHLRTAYLPQDGDPLVCRFENEGREILVEGVVAWRREHSRGGEFGVQFTALDSKSVESLRELCGEGLNAQPEDNGGAGPVGSRVRLHIDGLGSPMKARVKEGSAARVQVGSSLEFLKLGRKLEMEDIERGARREAHIDGVSVIVDPSTRVPQLVVALRFEGSEDVHTPSPLASDVAPRGARTLDLPPSRVTVGAGVAPATRPSPPADDELSTAEDAGQAEDGDPEMRGKVAQIAERAGERAKEAGVALAHASTSAARGAAGLFQAAADRIAKLRAGNAPRRTSSPKTLGPTKHRLRAQHPNEEADSVAGLRKLRIGKKGLIAGGVATLALGSVLAFSGGAEPPAVSSAAEPAEQTVAAEAPSAARAVGGAVTANVPLFGPTPLATTEPAPLAPGPGERGVEAAEKADATALSPTVPDLDWSEEERGGGSASAKSSDREVKGAPERSVARPEDVTPWGRGRMREPTIHRLRLDAPGASLQGNAEATGFSITVPSRKVMEAAAGIAKRDERIARIRATNTASGAQVSVQFKGPVPSYRVRLRKDYVELLLSAPGSEAESSDGKSKSAGTRSKPSR
jgi:hypothetical protein